MRHILLSLLSVFMLLGCSKERCTYDIITLMVGCDSCGNLIVPIREDSIISDYPDLLVRDGMIMVPEDHPDFENIYIRFKDGRGREFKAEGGCFRIPTLPGDVQDAIMGRNHADVIYSDDINFGETSDVRMADDGHLYKYALHSVERISIPASQLDRFIDRDLVYKDPSILTESGDDFYINGVPTKDGKEAVVKSLEKSGFRLTEKNVMDGITYAEYVCDELNDELANRITGGLFDRLDISNHLFNDATCSVYFSWTSSGVINFANITLNSSYLLSEDNAHKVNRRLEDLFGNAKYGNRRLGYMTYYNGYLESYYTNGTSIIITRF